MKIYIQILLDKIEELKSNENKPWFKLSVLINLKKKDYII
tara:strand:+ start:862 stop:981 length:120 start_codon:yes stop_codon:yes gene_type:complete